MNAMNVNGTPEVPIRVLVVDDDGVSREVLGAILHSLGYSVLLARSGMEALDVAQAQAPDIVFSDVLMPEMDGFQLCMQWHADASLRDIPFVFCSANYIDADDRAFALSLGAAEFLLKPLDAQIVVSAIQDALESATRSARSANSTASVSLDTLQRYNGRLFNQLQQKVRALEATETRLRKAIDGCLTVVSAAMESRDPYTYGHETRVALLAVAIAERVGMNAADVEGIRIAGMLHDVGKIAVPIEILSKPGRLSAAEFEMVKTHAAAGAEILKHAEFDQPIDRIVLQHHERINGSGYPQGLHGDEIVPAARIIAVADVVEAMSSHRPYRPALTMEAAMAEIRVNVGVLYDPKAAEACMWLIESGGFRYERAVDHPRAR